MVRLTPAPGGAGSADVDFEALGEEAEAEAEAEAEGWARLGELELLPLVRVKRKKTEIRR